MLRTLIIYAHYETSGYLYELLKKIESHHRDQQTEVETIRLYDENFQAIRKDYEDRIYHMGVEAPLDVHQYQEKIAEADQIIFLFPLWWGSFPAILKGFIERVFPPELAHREQRIDLYHQKMVQMVALCDEGWIGHKDSNFKTSLDYLLNKAIFEQLGFIITPIIYVKNSVEISSDKKAQQTDRILQKLSNIPIKNPEGMG